MNTKEFTQVNEAIATLIVDYNNSLKERNLKIDVEKGFLKNNIEDECPEDGKPILDMLEEFKTKMMKGIAPRLSPHEHSQLPLSINYQSIIAELLIGGLNSISVNWESSPILTELEMAILNWLAKLYGFPDKFLHKNDQNGGGVFQNTTTEAALFALFSARRKSTLEYIKQNPKTTLRPLEIGFKCIGYISSLATKSIFKISKISMMTLRILPANKEGKITAEQLRKAIEDDLEEGNIPSLFISTMGTADLCTYDNLQEIGPLCKKYNVWLHVEAAYAGNTLLCPEFRYMSNGIEFASSISMDLNKLSFMSMDVIAFWVYDNTYLIETLCMDPLYLKHKNNNRSRNLTNWQFGTGRRFKALQVWMVLNSLGFKGMQENIHNHIMYANSFEKLINDDKRFKVFSSNLGVICFALISGNEETQSLFNAVNDQGKISIGCVEFDNQFLLKFVVNQAMTSSDIDYAWQEIISHLK